MIITFTIPGNHEDPTGNAFPKVKLTGKQQWTPIAQRYAAWKRYVQDRFTDYGVVLKEEDSLAFQKMQGAMDYNFYQSQKPIRLDPGQTARMDIKIFWRNEAHPDPENVFGSIADALFANDKHLSGSFDFEHDPEGKGRVEVTITI